MKFIDRAKELLFLEEKWEEQKAQLVVLWGKRRVGKTELVKQFIKHRFSQGVNRHTNIRIQLTSFKSQL